MWTDQKEWGQNLEKIAQIFSAIELWQRPERRIPRSPFSTMSMGGYGIKRSRQ